MEIRDIQTAEDFFIEPPIEYKPRVLYMWPGNGVRSEELQRQMLEFKTRGFGGVTIWPIGRLHEQPPEGHTYVICESDEWYERVAMCILEGHKLGMKVGLSPGSGFPWSGKWVKENTNMQTLHAHRIEINAPFKELIKLPQDQHFETIVLVRTDDPLTPLQVLDEKRNDEGNLFLDLKEGHWELILYKSIYIQAMNGANDEEDKNLLVNFLDSEAVIHHLNLLILPILDKIKSHRTALDYIFFDSWEGGPLRWVSGFTKIFSEKRGYDIRPYMPIIEKFLESEETAHIAFGGPGHYNPSSPAAYNIGRYNNFRSKEELVREYRTLRPLNEMSDQEKRIIWDYRRTLGELLIENCYSTCTKWCRAHGLQFTAQVHGAPLIDWIDGYGVTDVPQAETYYANPYGGYEAASAAHIYGKNIVNCESYSYLSGTSGNAFGWTLTNLEEIRQDIDKMFAVGVNQVMPIITYTPEHSEYNYKNYNWWDVKRGVAGVSESQMNVYWKYYNALAEHTSRVSLMMRAGTIAHDVCVYKGDNILKFVRFQPENDVPIEFEGQWSRYPGDRITDRVIQFHVSMENSILIAGHGKYRAMIFDPGEHIILETLEKIELLVKEGLNLIAISLPRVVPGYHNHEDKTSKMENILSRLFPNRQRDSVHHYGNGCTMIVSSDQVMNALSTVGVLPHAFSHLGHDLRIMHRSTDDAEIYFLFNYSGYKFDNLEIYLKGTGTPELWNSKTGQIKLLHFAKTDEHIKIQLPFQPRGSNLVVIRKEENNANRKFLPLHTRENVLLQCEGTWNVQFTPFNSKQSFNLVFHQLVDWTRDRRLFHFAGIGIYEFSVHLNYVESSIMLDLGEVHDVAKVTINGHDAGIAYESPFLYSIGQYLNYGDNMIHIEVANRTSNAFNIRFPSGLVGPVRLLEHV
jgi:hypothetical protein